MQKSYLVPCLLLIAALVACSDKPIPPTAPPAAAPATVKPAATKENLMNAVFGKQYRAASKDALAQLPTFEHRGKKQTFVVNALATSQLATGETVLVAGADLPLEAQDEMSSNSPNSLVNVYLLREAAGKWVVLKRHESLVYRGYGDRPGSVLFPMLGKGKPGLAIISALNDEGCSDESLHLYDLSDDRPHDLAGMPTASIINQGCGGSDKFREESISGVWHLAPSKNATSGYHDLVFVFSDEARYYPVTDDVAAAAPLIRKKYTARYSYDGKRYKLISGKNPLMQP